MLVLASLVLGIAMLDALHRLDLVWLHPMPMRPCLGVTTWDASDAGLLHTYPSLFCSVRWYACHACSCHPLAFYTSLHACLNVHAWVLLASVSSILQHNEDMDTRSKLTFVPLGHHLLLALLLAYVLACLLSCSLAFLPVYFLVHLLSCLFAYLFLPCLPPQAMLAISILLVCFVPFAHYLRISFFPLLVCWFLVLAFACTHMERGRMELGHGLPGASKKGEDASMSI